MIKSNKTLMQFKVGVDLCNKIESSATKRGVSRNIWITNAIENQIKHDQTLPILLTASTILYKKKTVSVWVSLELLEKINKSYHKNRTIWLLDACISELARELT